jgi:PAS domain S-box-containing protein
MDSQGKNDCELRDTGLAPVGKLPWGSHFCVFYETKEDLLDVLVPYFIAGLSANELCIWVVPPTLTTEEANSALRRSVSSRDLEFAERQLEIYSHDEWYLDDARFNAAHVLNRWNEKLNQASAAGYAGLRASGDGGWVRKNEWIAFREYEEQLDQLISGKDRILLCTYPLNTSPGNYIYDAAVIHEVGVGRRQGRWQTAETAPTRQVKGEIKRLHHELEKKVEARTGELAIANQALRSEIAERELAVEASKQAEDRVRVIINTIPTIAWSLRPDGVLDFLNERWRDYTGLSLKEAVAEPTSIIHPEDRGRAVEKWAAVIPTRELFEDEMRLRRADGQYRWFLVRVAPLLDDAGNVIKWFGSSIDIEDRKRAEKDLQEAHRQLKVLSRRRVKVQEEERQHLARELHDEIGQALTAAKINLQAATEETGRAKAERIHQTLAILERLLDQVRQISLNLRPSILDDLGLVPALRSLLDEQGRLASVAVRFSAKDIPENMDPEIRTACFRIAQEAITNAVRHADATHIRMDIVRQDGTFRLQVQDDGKGFDIPTRQSQIVSLGLLGMKERAGLVGGLAVIASAAGKGTTVDVTLPVLPQAEKHPGGK